MKPTMTKKTFDLPDEQLEQLEWLTRFGFTTPTGGPFPVSQVYAVRCAIAEAYLSRQKREIELANFELGK